MAPGVVKRLRNSLERIGRAFGRPLVIKNVMNCGRLQVLAEAFPRALFVEVGRNVVDNAHSILAGKKRIFGSYEPWWSLEPKGFEAYVGGAPEVQVVQQIRLCRQMLADDLPAGRWIRVDYEALCCNPGQEFDRVEAFFTGQGVRCSRRKVAEFPDAFSRNKEIAIEADLYRRLQEYAASQQF